MSWPRSLTSAPSCRSTRPDRQSANQAQPRPMRHPGRAPQVMRLKISMISLPDLVAVPPVRWVRRIASNPSTPEGPPTSRHAGHRQRTQPATRAVNGRGTGILMTANLELTGRTPAFFVAASSFLTAVRRKNGPQHLRRCCECRTPERQEFGRRARRTVQKEPNKEPTESDSRRRPPTAFDNLRR